MYRAVNPSNTSSGERRRHARHTLSSTVYVDLGPNNGGILLNLGARGLSLQAVAKLVPEAELQLRFQLPDTNLAIQTAAVVTWVGSTQKIAGIFFKDSPSSVERQITAWIARQEGRAEGTETESETSPEEWPAKIGPPAPPVRPSPPERTATLDSVPSPAPTASPSRLPAPVENTAASSGNQSRKSAAKTFEPRVEAQSPPARPIDPEPVSPVASSPQPPAQSRTAAVTLSADRLLHVAAGPSASKSGGRRRRLAISVMATIAAIVVLIVIAPNARRLLNRPPAREHSTPDILPPAAPVSSVPPRQTVAKAPITRGSGTQPPPSAPAEPAPSVSLETHELVHQLQTDAWIVQLKALLGIQDAVSIDPAQARINVWTVQRSGFYYCAENPDYGKLRPGSSMSQGDALQRGYRPQLGSYCQ